jgi:hypothetical protein
MVLVRNGGAWVDSLKTRRAGVFENFNPGGGEQEPILLPATYSQSSVFSGNTAATQETMQNGITAEPTSTAVGTSGAFVLMDLGAVKYLDNVVIGCDFDTTLAGGWGKSWAEGRPIGVSLDGGTFLPLASSTGIFAEPTKAFGAQGLAARYVRIGPANSLAVTEFKANRLPIGPLLTATYSQSSLYSGLTAATMANMTNGLPLSTTATATNASGNEWVQADLGETKAIGRIHVAPSISVPGWGDGYIVGSVVEARGDGPDWTTIQTLSTMPDHKAWSISVNANYRYIRVRNPSSWLGIGQLAVFGPTPP